MAEFAKSHRVRSSIGMLPFEAEIGYVSYMPDDIAADSQFNKMIKTAQEFVPTSRKLS